MADWSDIYPGKRIITLILDPFEADELLPGEGWKKAKKTKGKTTRP